VNGVEQTILAGPEGDVGNCLQASVASMFGCRLEDVPHFAAIGVQEKSWRWWSAMRHWARERHVDFLPMTDLATVPWEFIESTLPLNMLWIAQYVLGSGHTERATFLHTVVLDRAGSLVWDPHPSKRGLLDLVEFEVVSGPYQPDPDTDQKAMDSGGYHSEIPITFEAA
jgi:hypothetical protein